MAFEKKCYCNSNLMNHNNLSTETPLANYLNNIHNYNITSVLGIETSPAIIVHHILSSNI